MKTRIYAGLSISLVALAMVGCGGNGSNPAGSSSDLPISGTANSQVQTLTTDIPASNEVQDVTINGTEAILPPTGGVVTAGTPLALFPAGTQVLGAMESDDSLTRGPIGAFVWKQGVEGDRSYIPQLVTRDGLVKPIAFTPGTWTVELNPCYVYKVANPSIRLNMRKITIQFEVNAEGLTSFPSVSGIWPTNSSSLADKHYANGWVNKAFAGTHAQLTIKNATQSIQQTKEYVLQDGRAVAQFRDLAPSANFSVPATGLTSVSYVSGF